MNPLRISEQLRADYLQLLTTCASLPSGLGPLLAL
jgi:hypothetical protein